VDVVVRHWREDDAGALSRAVEESLEHLRPWMPWIADEPKSHADRVALIRGWERERRERTGEFFGIWVDGRVAGSCGLHRRIGEGGLEIGYWVHPDHLRRGVATEAARQLVERAFAEPAVDRVEIHHDRANAPSGRIPARLGFERTGERRQPPEAPGEEGMHIVWRLTREAFEAR
jgi:RimJ/RimL family protein N-acetyltransferase